MQKTRAEASRTLIAYGFPAPKAGEIALDAERGNTYAAAIIQIATDNHPPAPGLLADVTA